MKSSFLLSTHHHNHPTTTPTITPCTPYYLRPREVELLAVLARRCLLPSQPRSHEGVQCHRLDGVVGVHADADQAWGGGGE